MAFRRKKEGYLGRLRRIGWGLGKEVGKALMVKAPEQASQKEREFEWLYLKKSAPFHQAERKGYGISGNLMYKKITRQLIKNQNPKGRVAGQRGVSAERMQKEAYPEWITEFGEDTAERMMRAVGLGEDQNFAHSMFGGGKRPSGEQVLDRILQQTRGVSRNKLVLGALMAEGLDIPPVHSKTLGFDAERAEAVMQKAAKLGVPIGPAFKKVFGHQEIPIEEESETDNKGQTRGFQARRNQSQGSIRRRHSWTRPASF